MARVDLLSITSVDGFPTFAVIATPKASGLPQGQKRIGESVKRHRAQFTSIRPDFLTRLGAGEVAPEDVNIEFLVIADEAGNIDVGAGQIGGRIEKIEEVLVARYEARFIGEQRF